MANVVLRLAAMLILTSTIFYKNCEEMERSSFLFVKSTFCGVF